MAVVRSVAELETIVEEVRTRYPAGAVIGLVGELGAGKTTFVREFVRMVHADTHVRVASPTFVIHQSYLGKPPIEHFDLYRFETASRNDLLEIGYYDAVESALEGSGYVFVEWPERASSKDLRLHSRIELEMLGAEAREILFR